jgi:hypothetical protein
MDDSVPSSGAYSWVLIAWVPDNARVRDKMLYSSSRDDLKRALGLGYFRGEFYANAHVLLLEYPFSSLMRVLCADRLHLGEPATGTFKGYARCTPHALRNFEEGRGTHDLYLSRHLFPSAHAIVVNLNT